MQTRAGRKDHPVAINWTTPLTIGSTSRMRSAPPKVFIVHRSLFLFLKSKGKHWFCCPTSRCVWSNLRLQALDIDRPNASRFRRHVAENSAAIFQSESLATTDLQPESHRFHRYQDRGNESRQPPRCKAVRLISTTRGEDSHRSCIQSHARRIGLEARAMFLVKKSCVSAIRDVWNMVLLVGLAFLRWATEPTNHETSTPQMLCFSSLGSSTP